jgi:hypothetical protein
MYRNRYFSPTLPVNSRSEMLDQILPVELNLNFLSILIFYLFPTRIYSSLEPIKFQTPNLT